MSLDEAAQLAQLQRGLVVVQAFRSAALRTFNVVGFCFLLISVSPLVLQSERGLAELTPVYASGC